MNATRHLELLALDCHRDGSTWAAFWQRHGDDVRKAEPYVATRYHRLVRRLLHLLTTGDESGQEPAGEPWLLDDVPEQPSPHDSKTQARCLLPLMPTPEGKRGNTTAPAGCSLRHRGEKWLRST
jgi:hypothetical protein